MADRRSLDILANQSKSGAVYVELRRRILEGDLQPGSPLNQEQLAAELGVSTTPLREALRRLDSEGLVTLSAHREASVAPLAPDGLLSIYEVREDLDALAASLAAERHSEADATAIRKAVDRLGTGSQRNQLALNRAFHAAIYRACGNPVLIEILDSLWDQSDRYRRAVGFMATEHTIVEEHREIAEAVLAGQGKQSADLMRRHIRRTRATFEQVYGGEAAQPAAAG
jgi:DNA-binding GntR family transcriptional regulator